MISKYVYKNKKTGRIFYSDEKLKNPKDMVLVREIKDGMLRAKDKNIIQKNGR